MKQISRRTFLSNGIKLAGFSLTAAMAASCQKKTEFTTSVIELSKVAIPIKNLPKEFSSYKIAFFSDIHLGPYYPKKWLIKALEILKQQKVDLFLMGGDYINLPEPSISVDLYGVIRDKDYDINKHKSSFLSKKIFNDCAQIVSKYRPKDGIFAVKGNHDNWIDGRECELAFERYGIKILNNKNQRISRNGKNIDIIGFDDYWTGLPSIKKAFRDIDSNSVKIILTHNPDFFVELEKHAPERGDLLLAGHTHAGQIKLPCLGPVICNIEHREFSEGLLVKEKSHYYTSRGLGVVEIPYRLNCPAELTVFELVPEY